MNFDYNSQKRLNGMLVAKFISDTGSWISFVLLLLYTNEVAISKAQSLSLVFAFRILMPLMLTPALTKFVDRFPSGKWLFACDFLAAIITISIPYFHSIIVTAIIAGILSTVTSIHFSAFNRLLKAYTIKENIKTSILRQSLLEGLSLLGGTSIAGVIGSHWSFKLGFAMDSISFLISGIIVLVIFNKYKFKKVDLDLVKEKKMNLFNVLSIQTIPWLLLISTFAAICFGLRDTTLIQLVVNELGMQNKTYAIIVAIGGIGGIFGNIFANRISLNKSYSGLVLVFIVIAVLYLGISNTKSKIFLYSITFFLGITEACYYYFRSHIFFSITPENHLAKTAGLFKVFNATARSSGMLIFGLGFSNLSPSNQFVIFSWLAIIAAIVTYFAKPNLKELE